MLCNKLILSEELNIILTSKNIIIMENYHHSVHELWQQFIETNPEYSNNKYKAWYFCDTEDCANKLAELVKQEIKRGTTSLYRWYESGGEILPTAGDLNVISIWDGTAQ